MKTIVLTGGGTAGHVTPNIALIPELLKQGYDIHYLGTENGLERGLIAKEKDVTYHIIKSGKLRRYMDIQNFTDPFRVIQGVGQSVNLIRKLKPNIIFSKGGFVSVPVVLGGWINKVPVIIHESDLTPGLANKISFPFAVKVCTTFKETTEYFKGDKGIYTGTPLRPSLLKGDPEKGMKICGFIVRKPTIMVMGGSLGAVAINQFIRKILSRLTTRFNVIHLCGKNNLDPSLENTPGYKQFEYVDEDLPHLMALASLIISRAGANSIYEFLALKKPNILIPLPLSASRGDQIQNAQSFERQGFSKVLDQETLTDDILLTSILDVYANRQKYIDRMAEMDHTKGVERIMDIINEYAKP
ncbi:MAG: undecaprenyldiphospho-muramoylpentapeptide beta-N-acetylglucosaminyltransferase [Caldicoprobacterales bacterium]|nr:undecaprenyldiphospho-muramoylpentapeptide beta-N-acetylglucosaminyltransferase [Clostridiales bacterium]